MRRASAALFFFFLPSAGWRCPTCLFRLWSFRLGGHLQQTVVDGHRSELGINRCVAQRVARG